MAATDFTGFTDETISFLADLKANNARDWFGENKPVYEKALKKPAEAFAGLMADELERLTGEPHKPKIFRINRDIRFSKDKSPYNSHLHISWTAFDGGEGGPAFMFGLEPEYLTIGCGTFEFPPALLDTYRKRIAAEQGDDLGRILDALKKKGFRLQDRALKRVPPGFPADHPHVELSLNKGIVVWRDFAGPREATQPDIIRRCLEHFGDMLPLWRFLRAL